MKKLTKEEFIRRAVMIHGDKYDYTDVEYHGMKTKVRIYCKACKKYFEQRPSDHLNSVHPCGCPRCAGKAISTREEFIEKAIAIHGDKYDYSEVVYKTASTPVKIRCKRHNKVFYITPANHLNATRPRGCRLCGIESRAKKRTKSTEWFIEQANRTHNKKYDYSLTVYRGANEPVTIICPEHGQFLQKPTVHLYGKGCPICGNNMSKAENEIVKLLLPLKPQQRNHNILERKEIDIYLPSHKIGIEHNGVRWHSEEYGKGKNYHLSKTEECNKQGVGLIHIFEDEWVFHKPICKNKLLEICGLSDNPEIYGDGCRVREVTKEEIRVFLEKNDLDGDVPLSLGLGAYYGVELMAVMAFKREKEGNWRIERITTNIDYQCVGVEGRIFEYFVTHYYFNKVRYLGDRRWIIDPYNNLYIRMGFKFVSFIKPSYGYYWGKGGFPHQRLDKNLFSKQRLHEKYGFPMTMTETEMAKEINAYRVWDCGKIEYVYYKKTHKI